MTEKIFTRISVLFLIWGLLFISGCAGRSPAARFYVLTPAPSSGEDAPSAGHINSETVITILPVDLPKYLRKSFIVTRTGGNQLQLAEYDRWAGKLEEDIGRVIAENLSLLLGTEKVISATNGPQPKADFQVKITIIQFDGRLGDNLELLARWSILDNQENSLYGIALTHISEATTGKSYSDMVAAQSRALNGMSLELASVIKKISGN